MNTSSKFTGDANSGATLNSGHIQTGAGSHNGNNNYFYNGSGSPNSLESCRKALLEALVDDPKDYRASLVTRKGPRVRATCDWIFKTKAYMDWMHRTPAILWISGDAGKGKTMLALYLLSHRERAIDKNPAKKKVLYFFCSQDACRNSGMSILRGLIYQLLDDKSAVSMFRHIREAWAMHGSRLYEESRFETLWAVFESMLRDPAHDSITCILDGLDECTEDSMSDFWIKLQHLFERRETNPKTSAHTLKMIITSRNHPDSIERALRSFPRIRLEPAFNEEIDQDIARFIEDRVKTLDSAQAGPEELHDFVKNQLKQKSEGTYLWVAFAIAALKKVKRVKYEDTLNSLPRDLNSMYRRMILSIPADDRTIVIEILRWVTTAFRPLNLLELGTAVNIKPAIGQPLDSAVEDYLDFAGDALAIAIRKTYCATTAQKDPIEEKTVVPCHSSVHDFLAGIPADDPDLGPFVIHRGDSHRKLARACFDYLQESWQTEARQSGIEAMHNQLDKPDESRRDISQYPTDALFQPPRNLKDYAISHGLDHFAESHMTEENLEDFLKLLSVDSQFHNLWVREQCSELGQLYPPQTLHLAHLVSLVGKLKVLQHCITNEGIDKDICDSHSRTPLFYATIGNQETIVAWLLKRGSKPAAVDAIGQTPLHIAAACGSSKIFSALIKRYDKIQMNSSSKSTKVQSMLRSRFDLETDISNPFGHGSGTPLHLAVENGAVEKAELLIRAIAGNKEDICVTNDNDQTVLHRASESTRKKGCFDEDTTKRKLAILKLLCTSKALASLCAGSNLPDGDGRTALHIAAATAIDYTSVMGPNEEEIKLALALLDILIDECQIPVDAPTAPSSTFPGGMTPLQIASKKGDHQTVAHLLNRGANPRHYDRSRRNSLHWLCDQEQSKWEIRLPILMQIIKGMNYWDLDAKDHNNESPLDLAIRSDGQYAERRDNWMKMPSGAVRKLLAHWWMLFCKCDMYYPLAVILQCCLDYIKENLSQEDLDAFVEYLHDKPHLQHLRSKRSAYQDSQNYSTFLAIVLDRFARTRESGTIE